MDTLTWRLTRKNPIIGTNGLTYRIPFIMDDLFREQTYLGVKVILGKVADVLGQYEDLGSITELSEMKKELIKYKELELYNKHSKITCPSSSE